MTKDQHKQLIEEITTEIDAALLDFQEDPNLPSIVVAEADDDYTNFTLILSTDKVGFIEAFASIPLFIYGETYHVFNGTNPESIIVSYIDQASGNVIETATSPGLEGLSEWLSDAE